MTDERLASTSVEGFLEVLGSDAPTPGGGAAGAIAGATGAALIAMVGRLTVGKKGSRTWRTGCARWWRAPTPRGPRSWSSRTATRTRSTA